MDTVVKVGGKKNAPKMLKITNLNHFIRFNFELLPTCRYSFQKIKGKMYFKVQDQDDTLVLINIL